MNDLICLWIGRIVFYTLGVIFILLWVGFSIRVSHHLYLFIRYVKVDGSKTVDWSRAYKLLYFLNVLRHVIQDDFKFYFLLGESVWYEKVIENGKITIYRHN